MPYNMEEIYLPLKENPFNAKDNQVVFYDPKATSGYSEYIEQNLYDITRWFREYDCEFIYIPDVCGKIEAQQIRYLIPNWDGGAVERLGNDLLKKWIPNRFNRRAGFIRFDERYLKFFALKPFTKQPFEDQLEKYKAKLYKGYSANSEIRFSMASYVGEEELTPLYETKLSLADKNFSEDEISAEIRKIAERLHKEGFEEFVLRCMVPTEKLLSRLVITPNYDIVLPDYNNMAVEMGPLPKAVFLLYLRHNEGIFFKDLIDHQEEIRRIYEKITNRTSAGVIDDSLEKLTNPTDNAINEKCSRIREAFVKLIDKSLAENYYVTGTRSQAKRIKLPRNLVDWQCEI